MIYFKHIQSETIIEFTEENVIGDIFYDTTIYKKLNEAESKVYETAKELAKLKQEKLIALKELYIKNQLAIVKDSITFPLPLQGDHYKDLKDRRNEAKENFQARVLVRNLENVLYQSTLPYIVFSELIFVVNFDYSEFNKTKFDTLTELINKQITKEDLSKIDINQFKTPITIDIDKLIRDTNALTDAVLMGKGYNYTQAEITIFKDWVKTLQVDASGKYIIFQKAIA
jgi:hypothetical protein